MLTSIKRFAALVTAACLSSSAGASPLHTRGYRTAGTGQVTVTWAAPARGGDNTALSNLSSFHVDCGYTRSGPYTITSGALSSATLTWASAATLRPGTLYCTVIARDSGGSESFDGIEVSKVIP